jgi:hypothetical protein
MNGLEFENHRFWVSKATPTDILGVKWGKIFEGTPIAQEGIGRPTAHSFDDVRRNTG